MRVIITGASGHLGRLVAERVLARCPAEHVILATHHPDALADLTARGVTVRFADFDDPRDLTTAFTGGRRMLLISTTDLTRRADQHRAAIDAAARSGVEHVIYTSMLAPAPPNPAVIAPSHFATEQYLARSHVSWTVLRHSLYAEYQAAEAARAAAAGSFVHNRGNGSVAYVSRTDCAGVAAEVLTTGGHERRVYEITGPERYDAPSLAALYGDLAGRTVDAVALDDEAFIDAVLGPDSLDDHARYGAELVASLGRATREGYLAACTNDVERLSGFAARPLRSVLEATLHARS